MGLFSKPKVRYAGEVDVGNVMGDTFALNRRYLDDASSLSSQISERTQKQALDLMEQAMPGISKVRGMLMNQLQQDLSTTGLPKEVEANLARKAAEMGISRGTAGDFNKFSALRDLGIEHTKMVEFRRRMATFSLQQLFQSTPRVNPMSPQSMLMTPGQNMQIASQNLDRRQALYNAQAQMKAQRKQNIMKAITSVAGIVAAPFTGGLSLGLTAGAMGGEGGGGGGGGGMPSLTTSSGAVNYGGQGFQSVGHGTNLSNPFGSPY